MKLKYLLDTDVFSLMVKGLDPAINQRLETLGKGEATLSVITTGEFFYGVAHAPISALRQKRTQRLIDFWAFCPSLKKQAQRMARFAPPCVKRARPSGQTICGWRRKPKP